MEEAAQLGAIQNQDALHRLSRLCKSHLSQLISKIQSIAKVFVFVEMN